jgi:hypothetical protein
MQEETRPNLRREVVPPQGAPSSWGLIVVAATAMSFALAGSLLMVRATATPVHVRHVPLVLDAPPCMQARPPVRPRHLAVPAPTMAAPPAACRGPVYHANADGKAEAVFELCPPAATDAKLIRVVDR